MSERMRGGPRRYRLENGMTLLVEENHSTPVVAVLTHVKAGYFHEEDRLAGVSHLLEHMFFKGTPTRPGPEDIARETRALGGMLNAFTYYEETGYYAVAPAERFADVLDIQADALMNTMVDADELRRETEVVLQEAEQKRDSPWALAIESLYALAFDRHRIRRWRIGEPDALRSWTREDVLGYYRAAYRPESIILAVCGDVKVAAVETAARRLYEGWRGGTASVSREAAESPAPGPRYRRMRGDIRQRLALFGFHTVPARHPDAPALNVLEGILGDGRASRLYRGVRERQRLCSVVSTSHHLFEDFGYFTVAGESLGDDVEQTERALWAEVRSLWDAPPTPEEMRRARTRWLAREAFGAEEPLGRARRIAEYEALGGYELEEEERRLTMAVTPEDVRRVARTYLTPQNAALLEYVPNDFPRAETDAGSVFGAGPAAVDRAPAPESAPALRPLPAALTIDPPGLAEPERRLDLPGGGTLSARPTGAVPVVGLEIVFPGGRLAETERNAGITYLMARAMLKGTQRRTGPQIAEAFEGLGSTLDWIHGSDLWGFGFAALADRFHEALDLAVEVIASPAFRPEDVDREREAVLADIRRAGDSGADRTMDLLDAAAYATHPYGFPERGLAEVLERLGPGDLIAWHRALVAHPRIAGAAGAVNPDALHDALAIAFPGRAAVRTGKEVPRAREGLRECAETRDRRQTTFALGYPTVPAQHEDRFALDALGQILSGLGGRLFAEVRGRRGLAYTVMAWHAARAEAGLFITYTATAPENEDAARVAILEEYDRIRQAPVTPDELDRARAYIAGTRRIQLQTARAHARDLSRAALYGRPLEASRVYVERIQALTREDLLRAAQTHFTPERYALGALRGTSAPDRARAAGRLF